MSTYKCPEAECEGIMEEGATKGQLECSECDHQISEETADYLFDQGLIILEMDEEAEEEFIEEAEKEGLSVALNLLADYDAYKEIQEFKGDIEADDLKDIYEKYITIDSDGIDFIHLQERLNEMIEEKEEVSEELDTILEGADFDADFKDKAKTLFEAAIALKVKEEILRLQDLNESFVAESVAEKSEALELKVDEYLSYVAEEYLKENEIALEAGMKVEAAEKILEGVAELMEQNHIHIEEDKVDAYQELEDQYAVQESELNSKIDETITLSTEVKSLKREIILDTVSEGLSEVQKEKLATLTEDIDFNKDADFITKVTVIKESFFDKKVSEVSEEIIETVEGKPSTSQMDFINSVVSNLNKD